MSDEKPKIIVDEDWKSKVEREREQFRDQGGEAEPHAHDAATGETAAHAAAQPASGSKAASDFELPPPSLPMLVSTLATQAIAAMGQLPDPETGQPTVRPKFAKYHIDLLAVLQEKTKGNLTPEEADMLEAALHELRMIYVQVVK